MTLDYYFLVVSTQSLSASIKDTAIDGIEGLNFNFDLPFKIDDNLGSTLLGFRHKFGESLKRGPSALYLKRTFNIGDENAIVIDTQYESKPNVFSIGTKWVSDGFKVALGIDVNTKRFPWGLIPSADFTSKQNVDGWKLNSAAGFNAEKLSVSLSQEVGYGTTAVKIDYDTEKHNPVVRIITAKCAAHIKISGN